MDTGAGSLKCVAGWSPSRSLGDSLEQALRAHAGDERVRHLYGDAFLVYTEADTSTVRDWLAPLLEESESVFVVEFERWSGHGPAIDSRWLMRRGH